MNKKRICLVTSGHPPFDERIFWKFGKSLTEAGFSVAIICSTQEINKVVDGIIIDGFDGRIIPEKEKDRKILQFDKSIQSRSDNLLRNASNICSFKF